MENQGPHVKWFGIPQTGPCLRAAHTNQSCRIYNGCLGMRPIELYQFATILLRRQRSLETAAPSGLMFEFEI